MDPQDARGVEEPAGAVEAVAAAAQYRIRVLMFTSSAATAFFTSCETS
jgi:hypothetical protein